MAMPQEDVAMHHEMPSRRAATKKVTLTKAHGLGLVGYEDGFFNDVDVMMETGDSSVELPGRATESCSKREKPKGLVRMLRQLLASPAYDYAVSGLIMANAVSIGLDQKFRLERDEKDLFKHVENFFLLVYILELCLQFSAWGCRCLGSNWVRCDCVLVVVSMGSYIAETFSGPGQGNPMASFLVLRLGRLLRLARLLRTVRLLASFRELWMLARGLMSSIGTAVYTLTFGLVIMYVIGCAAIELIPLSMRDEEPLHDNVRLVIDENFRSLPVTLLTLVQFTTFDNLVQVYKPLIEADYTLAFFFIPVLLVIGVVFMNLVTAVIVNKGLEQSMQDKAMRKAMMKQQSKCLIAELLAACLRADANSSGTISKEELHDIDLEGLAFLEGTMGVDDLAEIFDCLDVDGHGEIGIQEFCQCIDSIIVTETPPVLKRMERMIESMRRQLDDLTSALNAQAARPPSQGRSASKVEAAAGRPKPGWRPSVQRTQACKPDGNPMPAWADDLISEVRQICTTDVQIALEEACRAVMTKFSDTTTSGPSMSQGFSGISSSSSERATAALDGGADSRVPAALDGSGRWQALCSAAWEVLPPDLGRSSASDERRRSQAPARSPPQPSATLVGGEFAEHRGDRDLRLVPLDHADMEDEQAGGVAPEHYTSEYSSFPRAGVGLRESKCSCWL